MASMLDNLRGLVSPEIVSALATKTGEPESAVSSGLSAAVPAIAAAIAGRADDHSFMKELSDLATKVSIAPDPSSAMPGAGSWLSGLFGSGLSALAGSIARSAGLSESSAGSLIAAAAPLVLGYLGKIRHSEGLTVSDMADRLREAQPALAAAVPAGIELPKVGGASIDAAGSAVDDTASSIAARIRSDRTPTNVAVAVAGLLAAIGVGSMLWWTGHKPSQQARVEVGEPAFKPVGTSGLLAPFTRRLPGNVTITFPAGSGEDRMSMYLASAVGGATTVNCDRIAFDKGSATLTPLSREQLANIATILRAYPNAKITVTGHTDSMGNEAANQTLSTDRAQAVADNLIAAAVSADRIRVEGAGSRVPVTGRSDDAGRAQNDRVTIDVSVK